MEDRRSQADTLVRLDIAKEEAEPILDTYENIRYRYEMCYKYMKIKHLIASMVRDLRERRGWSQEDLAGKLGVAQPRLSLLERGQASFTAEQFLEILSLFNVPASAFAAVAIPPQDDLQNALARAGARHLQESEAVPTERYRSVDTVISEVLVEGGPVRHMAALAPVLVENAGRVDLARILERLDRFGYGQRLGWLAECALGAIREESRRTLSRALRLRYRRAERYLEGFLELATASLQRPGLSDKVDTLGTVLPPKGLKRLKEKATDIDRRWGVYTSTTLEDFGKALRESLGCHKA